LRTWLLKKTGESPDDIAALWPQFVQEGLVEAALDLAQAEDEVLGDLVNVARRYIDFAKRYTGRSKSEPKQGPRSRGDRTAPAHPLLSETERERALALSEYLSRQAGAWPKVKRLHRELLNGRLLSSDHARQLVISAAARILPKDVFTRLDIPVVGHRALVVDEKDNYDTNTNRVTRTATVRFTAPKDVSHTQECVVRDHGRSRTVNLMYHDPETNWAGGAMEVWPGSVLAEIRELGLILARRYHWIEAQAQWYLLTGKTPLVLPISVQLEPSWAGDHSYQRISMTVEPWVPADAVMRLYRAEQRRALKGRENRPLGARTAPLVRFIAARMDDDANPAKWRDSMAAWNGTYPQWEYMDVSLFWRHCQRAIETICFPPLAPMLPMPEGNDDGDRTRYEEFRR
jgi:hypothetical protein